MKLEDLKMGDMLQGQHGFSHLAPKTLIVMEENDGFTKRLMILWHTSCYFFETNIIKELEQEEEYWNAIRNDEYKVVGNICTIMNKVLEDE